MAEELKCTVCGEKIDDIIHNYIPNIGHICFNCFMEIKHPETKKIVLSKFKGETE